MLAVYVTLGVTAILLNVLFFSMLCWKSKLSTTHRNYLLTLSISNIVISLLCLNWDIRMSKVPMGAPPWVCVLQFYGMQMGLYTTLGTVVAMSVDKYIAIQRPTDYKTICSIRNTRIAISVVVGLSIVLALLPTGDFVANISPVCTILDLYPQHYGLTIVGTFFILYLIAQIITLFVLVKTLVTYIVNQRKTEELRHRGTVIKGHRATIIVIGSSVSYIITITIIAASFFFLSGPSDLIYAINHDFSFVASCTVIVITYIDPLIYFLVACQFAFPPKVSPASHVNAVPGITLR